MSWSSRLRRVASLGPWGLVLVVRSRVLLGVAGRILRDDGFAAARRWSEGPLGKRTRRGRKDVDEAERIARVVAVASRLASSPFTCLPRSLVLRRMMAGRGIRSELRVGVATTPGFTAHAWVELDGRPVGEPPFVTDRFATLEERASSPQAR